MDRSSAAAQSRSDRLVIRLSPKEKAILLAAAEEESMELAAWARRLLIRAARGADVTPPLGPGVPPRPSSG